MNAADSFNSLKMLISQQIINCRKLLSTYWVEYLVLVRTHPTIKKVENGIVKCI